MRHSDRTMRLIRKMEERGYHYDELESHSGWWHFFGAYSTMAFQTWKEVETWLKETEDLYGAEN